MMMTIDVAAAAAVAVAAACAAIPAVVLPASLRGVDRRSGQAGSEEGNRSTAVREESVVLVGSAPVARFGRVVRAVRAEALVGASSPAVGNADVPAAAVGASRPQPRSPGPPPRAAELAPGPVALWEMPQQAALRC